MDRQRELKEAYEALLADPQFISSIFDQFVADAPPGQMSMTSVPLEEAKTSGNGTDADPEVEDTEQE